MKLTCLPSYAVHYFLSYIDFLHYLISFAFSIIVQNCACPRQPTEEEIALAMSPESVIAALCVRNNH